MAVLLEITALSVTDGQLFYTESDAEKWRQRSEDRQSRAGLCLVFDNSFVEIYLMAQAPANWSFHRW